MRPAGGMRRPGLRPLLFLGVLILAACTDRPRRPGSEAEFDVAPDYRAFTLTGDTVSLASFRGRPVLLNLWATWCPPCREEMPSLQRVHRDYAGRGLRVIGVSLDNGQSRAAIRRFLEQYRITFTILHDPHDDATTVFRTFGLPETLLIAADGRLVRRWRGKVDGDSREFRKYLDRLLRAGS